MKRATLLILVFLLAATPVLAYSTPWHKLSSGVKQVVTGPFSMITVPNEQMNREHDKFLGLLGGLMEGAAEAGAKTLKGAFNILTFPFVNHDFDLDE